MSSVAEQDLCGDFAIYQSNWDYLSDRLRHLDLGLRILLSRTPSRDADSLAPFKGLVISDAEISRLLDGPQDRAAPLADHERKSREAAANLHLKIRERSSATQRTGESLFLPRLSELFGLTQFEEQCLVVCLAPELDRKYEKLYAYLQDDSTQRKPTVDFVLRLLCESQAEQALARAAFKPDAPLRKFMLLNVVDGQPDSPAPLVARALKLDDRIVDFVLGQKSVDARLERLARIAIPHQPSAHAPAAADLYQSAVRFMQAHFLEPQSANRNLMLWLHGPADREKRAIVEALCGEFGLPLLVADVAAMQAGPRPIAQSAWLLGRESALKSAALLMENMDSLVAEPDKHRAELDALIAAAKMFSRLTFMFASAPWRPQDETHDYLFLSVAVPRPDVGVCKRLWDQGLAASNRLADDVDSAVLASAFRFGASEIHDALQAAENLARWRSPQAWRITAADLAAACRAQSSPRLGALAHKIEPRHSWSDIVLPQDALAQLKELCEQARHRHRVYGEWGFDRKLSLGKGLNALFSGPPGTGKTMAAEVIANELRRDLYRIDLSQVVSKYIGETEKNLHHIFQEAQTAHAILFFDEADALFGKRSEVKDAHDRYANIEVGYLLQKMEEYEGVAILATNLSRHIDEAFVRRMHFMTDFPFPDEEHRRQIWQVVFPHEAPLADKVDFDLLAREIKLAGGNIKNIALAAAFYAAGDGQVIEMRHLWRAARREHQKLGRTWEETRAKG